MLLTVFLLSVDQPTHGYGNARGRGRGQDQDHSDKGMWHHGILVSPNK